MSEDFLLPGAGAWANRARAIIRSGAAPDGSPARRKPEEFTRAYVEQICVRGVGERLMHLRARANLTLDQVAAQTGISKSETSRLETGKRKVAPRHLAAFAPLYGLTETGLNYLLAYAPSEGIAGEGQD